MDLLDLLERDFYLEDLAAGLKRAAAGNGSIALVMGEAGIGKTSLLRAFAAQKEKSARILWGGCEALFTPQPLAPLYDIARQIGGELPAILADSTRRDLVFHAAIEALSRVPGAPNKPTVVIFEDAHWADEATLDLIKFLGRRLHKLPVLLVVSYRDDEVNPRHPLCSVIGDLPSSLVDRLRLAPLSPAAVAKLAREAGQTAQRLYEVTGGNPFFVTEALAVAENEVPPTVRDAVIARMARLSDSARTIVNLAAVVPGKAERWLLDATAEHGAEEVDAALGECLRIGMMALPDGAIAFRHELARRAAEEQLPLPERRPLHVCILAALQTQRDLNAETGAIHSDVSLARLVHHADLAGDSAAVSRFAPAAAERAANLGSHREAAAHYATALRHAASLPDVARAALYENRAYECYLTEQIAEAIEARLAALALRRAEGNELKVGDNLRWLSRLSWFNGNKVESDSYAKQTIACLSALPPGRELAMAYSNCAQLYMLADQTDLALEWGGKAITLATELGDSETLSHALNNVGTAKLRRAEAEGRNDLEQSLALALDKDLQEHAARAYTNLGSTATRAYDLERAHGYLNAGIAYCEAHDLESWNRYMTAFRAVARLESGDWSAAAEDAQSIIKHPRAAIVSKIPALVVLGLVRVRRGDPGGEAALDQARDLALPTGEMQRIGMTVTARAEAAWLNGRPETVMEELRAAFDESCAKDDSWSRGELGTWLLRCGGADPALVPNLVVEAPFFGCPFALQMAGNWRAAAETWGELGCPYEQALALAESDDEGALRDALEICDRLGAAPLGGIVRRKLRASGVRGITRGAQERTRANPQGLTNSELKVLGLLVQGRRNADIARRLFVSEKTVGHHVSAILAKLEVRSRGEAAAAASRLGIVPPAPFDPGDVRKVAGGAP
jgi:DNA-binding CsgD family transcriptional regulator